MTTRKNTRKQDIYWRRVRRLTIFLLFTWFAMTFGTAFFARELSTFTIFGWPFSFYMAGQGLTVFYLVIVAVYMKRMQRLDKILTDETSDVE